MKDQKLDGGVPTASLTPADIVTYYGAIIASNKDGDLVAWNGDSDVLDMFSINGDSTYDYSGYVKEDLEKQDLVSAMELADGVMG
jgi:hypothetical protein